MYKQYDKIMLFSEPEIYKIAETRANKDTIKKYMKNYNFTLESENVIEVCGKHSTMHLYKTEKSTDRFIKELITRGHLSVLEHESVTFIIRGCTRSMVNQLERHRHFSFTQASTRFEENPFRFVLPIGEPDEQEFIDFCNYCAEKYLKKVTKVKFQKHEVAKAYLNLNLEAPLCISGNIRCWLEMIDKRDREEAGAEIQRLVKLIKTEIPYL